MTRAPTTVLRRNDVRHLSRAPMTSWMDLDASIAETQGPHDSLVVELVINETMASVSFLTRSVARRSFDKVVRLNQVAKLGSVRFSSYFTPGTYLASFVVEFVAHW